MNNTKKLTQASLLSALFVVSTIMAVGSGFGYALYLDFIVPIYFCIVYMICGFKYTTLSATTSLIITGLVIGNIGTAIWASQSIFLGIMCAIFMNKNTTIVDDMVYTSIIGVFIMVFIDIYASSLIGYSFMKEFQSYTKIFKNKDFVNTIYYLFIAFYPFGTVFSIYYLSLVLGRRLNLLNGNIKAKFKTIVNFKTLSRYICCSKKVFYGCVIYIILAGILVNMNLEIGSTYLKTILISTNYLCLYFVIRDGYTILQNYLMIKQKKVAYIRLISIITLLLLIFMFRIVTAIIIIINIILDKKLNIRTKQISIVNTYISKLQ